MEALWIGLGLGLAAGFSPGPLLTLVLTSTLKNGVGSGLRVASAPLLTDLPIVVSTLWLASSIPRSALDGLALVGGAFVIFLGVVTWRGASEARLEPGAEGAEAASRDLLAGALVNALSPHPWLFWIGIGAPQVVELYRRVGTPAAAGFLALFYTGLVGSKALLAVAVAGGRHALSDAWYRRILIACGALLVGLGSWLGWDGLRGLSHTWRGVE